VSPNFSVNLPKTSHSHLKRCCNSAHNSSERVVHDLARFVSVQDRVRLAEEGGQGVAENGEDDRGGLGDFRRRVGALEATKILRR
jgi:hypothetical protein